MKHTVPSRETPTLWLVMDIPLTLTFLWSTATARSNARCRLFLCCCFVLFQVQQGLMEVPWPKGLAEMSEDGSNGSSDGCTGEKPQQQGGSPGNGSSSSPPRKKCE